MADDSFFGFDADFPNVLGRSGFDEELLTPDVEEEYDALNDETFGQAANDDWEEAHEKLSELIKNNNIDVRSYFKDSLLENDDSQVEIVSKSISQLGLEDDLDDPAIMTVSRNCQPMTRLSSVFGPSPPPPAILETENCGSPKTHSIWSTTPKDSGLSFIHPFHSHNSSSSFVQQEPRTPLNSTSDNVFLTPHKAWRVEELEKDLLSASSKEQSCASNSWPQPSQINTQTNQNLSNNILSRFPVNTTNCPNKINRVLTREEVERQMLAEQRLNIQNKAVNLPQPPQLPRMTPPMMHPNAPPPVRSTSGNNLNSSLQSPSVVSLGMRGPVMRGSLEPFVPFSANHPVHPRNILNHQMPRSDYMMPNPTMGGVINPFLGFPRQINHPLLPNYRHMYEKHYDKEEYRNGTQDIEDDYAGLMTQKEKEWLCKIQMMLLKFENPYVEDYYFTISSARSCKKKYSENARKGDGDAPELILPETPKLEYKTYVPTQFEGSLGKLQAVSVNFPRKVLDIKVARPLEDDEGRIVTNQCLLKYRRLLLDIEKLYTYFLEIEDEEKRILAKPDTDEAPHRKNIDSLTQKIFKGLCSENSYDDIFQNIMTIRKGRNLLARVLPLFNLEQQLQCLICLCRSISLILKKDQNDLVFVKNYEVLICPLQKFSLKELAQLGEALQNGMSPGSTKDKNIVAAFKNKFGSTVICSMITKAEALYSGRDVFGMDIQTRWANVILCIVDILCNLENRSFSPSLTPTDSLLKHIQRFDVSNDKIDLLKEKLSLLERDSKKMAEMNV